MINRLGFCSLLFSLIFGFGAQALSLPPGERLRALPVQADGRIKPFDTFAQEMLEVVYGKKKYEGRRAHEIILTWMLSPKAWEDKEIFEVRNKDVLKALGLDDQRRYFRGGEIFGNEKFSLLRQDLQEKREAKEKLSPYFQALQRLENQYYVFTQIATGQMVRLVPPALDSQSEAWISVAEFDGPFRDAFFDLTTKFVNYISVLSTDPSGNSLKEKGEALDLSVIAFEELAKAKNPSRYADSGKINAEIHYNLFHPFRWAYICYLLAALIILWMWTTNKSKGMALVWFFVAVGFCLHTYGFGLRVYLTDRPPVSNMYETVVWVAWGVILFSTILEMIYKFRFIIFSGAMVGWVSLVMADSAPAVLDPSLQPLEAVLRSNYWLIVHVMTITISYAAFFLAFGLGDVGLYYYFKGEKENQDKIKSIVKAIYRSKQIGVCFLAPGIILGGVWADESWGRFWGWDPKETWALIALLGYIAVLHGRLVGWIKDFGMVVSGVLTFSLVIMAWYGVNFVLGAGLHSYGFGAGGLEYVSAFVFFHFLMIIYVALLRSSRKATTL